MGLDAKGRLGTLDFYISQNPGLSSLERYRRQFIPVTPASRQIPGSPDAVAPDTTIAQWSINDWSQGEGDLIWRDRGRYRISAGMGPASDGSGLVVGPRVITTQHDAGGGDFDKGWRLARCGNLLLAGRDGNDKLYKWDATNSEWDDHWTIGGPATYGVWSIAAVNDVDVFVVISTDGTLRKVQSASNSTHVNSATMVEPNGHLVSYQGKLYLTQNLDLYEVNTFTANTITLRGDVPGTKAASYPFEYSNIATSDVGPIWLARFDDGRNELWEYNVADDSAYVIAQLPRDVVPYTPYFYEGIYFVTYRTVYSPTTKGLAYLYYAAGGQRGSIGPLDPVGSGGAADEHPAIAGASGDRVYVIYNDILYAYDLSVGGLSQLGSTNVAINFGALVLGQDVFVATNAGSGGKVDRFSLNEVDLTAGTLHSGRFDFGYLGLQKAMTKVTVVCEDALETNDAISVAVAVEGGSFTSLSGSMGSGDVKKTWPVSTSSTTFAGVTFEIRVTMTAGAVTQNPKIISIDAEAIGVESRLEWTMAIDVTDGNTQHGQTIIDTLETLRTNKLVVAFSNPFDDLETTAAVSYDATVEDLTMPVSNPGSDDYAIVRVRATQTV